MPTGRPSHPPEPSKEVSRTRAKARLAGLAPAIAARAAGRMAEIVESLAEVRESRAVLCCLSFGTEIDTWGLVERLLARGLHVYVPRAEPATRTLSLHRFPCELETLPFGLKQPAESAPALPPSAVDSTLGAALVAGLAFDRAGYRLGYGGGYFDRFLAGRPFPPIGLAYEIQRVERLPREPHDVPMAAVATERAVHRSVDGDG